MSGMLLHAQAIVICAHVGRARPAVPSTRVQLSGQRAVMLPVPYTVTGCPLPPAAGGPCVTARWVTGATRVLIEGSPALLTDSTGTCLPTGASLTPLVTQLRVRGS
jgi:hypothetical protein